MEPPAVLSVFGVEPFRIGGNEAFARELSRQLGGYGWRSILCGLDTPPAPVRRFLQLPNVTLEVLEKTHQQGWRAARGFAALLHRYRPTIVHLHFTPFLAPYPWLAWASGVKMVVTTDQTSRPEGHVARRAPSWKRALTRLINHPITRVISVSDYGYRCLTVMDVLPLDRFARIYNGVDLSLVKEDGQFGARFRAKHGIPATDAVVLQVSWIIPSKGIVDLLSVARLLTSRGVKARFVFAGEGRHRAQYTKLAAEMGLTDLVTWTGMVEDPFAEGVYAAADVVCQVSRWEEVFGWTIAEAMAHRKPLVATRVGGIPELVRDGETGFLVERGDVAAMADRIARLLGSPALRERMGQAGRRDVEAKFDLTRNVARLLKLYGITDSSRVE